MKLREVKHLTQGHTAKWWYQDLNTGSVLPRALSLKKKSGGEWILGGQGLYEPK